MTDISDIYNRDRSGLSHMSFVPAKPAQWASDLIVCGETPTVDVG